MKNIFKTSFIIPCSLLVVLTTGCITSKKTEAIKNDLKSSAIADLKSATVDVKKIALKDLTNETVDKTTTLDDQFKAVIDALKANGVDSTENVMAATEKYMQERDRVKSELMDRARFYTNLLIKIDNGWLSIESLDRMNQSADEARKSIFVDVMSKDIPMVLASFYASGKIDQDFLNIISQYLGSSVQTVPAESTKE